MKLPKIGDWINSISWDKDTGWSVQSAKVTKISSIQRGVFVYTNSKRFGPFNTRDYEFAPNFEFPMALADYYYGTKLTPEDVAAIARNYSTVSSPEKKAQILDGKLASAALKDKMKTYIQEQGLKPTLEVILVGDDPASAVYVKDKCQDCESVGIQPIITQLPDTATTEEVIEAIYKSWADGIIVQLPLPSHIDKDQVIRAIPFTRDVDCLRDINIGNLFLGGGVYEPCMPAGIIELLYTNDIEVCGKHCVVVDKSNIAGKLGKFLALILINYGATVTVCNSHTANLEDLTKQADILISAAGKPKFITSQMVKPGVIVIDAGTDVGINRDAEGNLCGDVDFEEVSKVASWITPVPGGVGLMTRAILLQNTIWACKNRQGGTK